ncbi:MAG: hypothetical protein QME96_16525, partial [Myxococcota bacterium]|nr:hypothetical protein [Myxococcota bacterium]
MERGAGRGWASERRVSGSAALPALAAAAFACGQGTAPRSVRVTLSSEATVPDDVDGVEMTITASRTVPGATCFPVTRTWDRLAPGDLPIVIDLMPGETYDSWVAVRVRWLKGSAEVAFREIKHSWPASGALEIEIRLERACLGVGCAPDQECLEGRCSDLPEPGPFREDILDTPPVSCDRNEGPPDAGTGDADADGDGCTGPYCDSGNCDHGVCCAPGATCCSDDSHCVIGGQHLACNTGAFACFEACGPGGVGDDDRCAAGYHCDANVCFVDIVTGDCDEHSDCASAECRDGYCCQHAGLCCAVDADCPDLFDGCATDTTRTCVYSARPFPDTGLGGICYGAADAP